MKNKIISVLSVIIILSCFFFIPKINAATLEEQKQENQEKKEQAEKKKKNKKENEKVVSEFLKNNSEFELIEQRTTFPSKDGGDGFFYALMVKND